MARDCEKCGNKIKDGIDGVDARENRYAKVGTRLEIFLRGPARAIFLRGPGIFDEYEREHSWSNSGLCPKCGKQLFDILHDAGMTFIHGEKKI